MLAPWALPWQRDGARWKGAGAAERGRAGTRAEERTEVKRSASQGQCAAPPPPFACPSERAEGGLGRRGVPKALPQKVLPVL